MTKTTTIAKFQDTLSQAVAKGITYSDLDKLACSYEESFDHETRITVYIDGLLVDILNYDRFADQRIASVSFRVTEVYGIQYVRVFAEAVEEPETIDVRDEDETEKMHRRSRADHLRDEVARHDKDIADASAIRSETFKELAELAASEDADYQSLRALVDRIARCDNRIEVATAYRAEAMAELNGSKDEAAEFEPTGLSELPISGEHPTAAEFNSIFPFIPLSHRRFLDKGGNHIDSALHQDAEVLRIEHEHGTDMVYVTLDVEPEAEFCFEDFEVVSKDEILAMDCNYNIEGERAYRLLRGTDSCIISFAQGEWCAEYIHWYYDADGEMVEDYMGDFVGDAPYKVCDEASAYAVEVAELIKAEGRD